MENFLTEAWRQFLVEPKAIVLRDSVKSQNGYGLNALTHAVKCKFFVVSSVIQRNL